MEGLLYNTNSAGIQNELVNQSVDKQVILETKAVSSSKHVVIDKDESQEAQQEKYAVNGHTENDSETLINGVSSDSSVASQKTVAPTLIGSAIQAVKNLFSPDKTKGKSVSILSPNNQQINAGSQHIIIPGKAETSSEPAIEILNNVQFASEGSKNNFQIPEAGGTQSPLTLEPRSSMDETFFTTVSLIDESFHSTVTDLDEHEALKNGINFIGNVLNNSQKIELVDPYNATLESNESHLENTTLQVGSFTSEGNEMCNLSVLNVDGNAKNFDETRDCDFISENDVPSGSGKVREETEGNMPNGQTQSEESKNSEKEKSVSHSDDLTPSNATICLGEINCDRGVSDIFLNNSFEDPAPFQENDTGINFVGSNDEPIFVQGSISSTTIVLDSNSDITSLKTDDLDSCISSLTCFEGESVTGSFESMILKPLQEPHSGVSHTQVTDSLSYPRKNFSSMSKEKRCASEGNSPNNTINSNKIKLNKSDELINHRLCEPLDGKWAYQEKTSSVDVTLIKNIEASEVAKGSSPFDKVTEPSIERQSEAGENESSIRPNSVPVISQQSYTILTHDNRLNRPVIEPVNTCGEPSEKQTFQMTQLDGTLSTDVETSLGKNCKNTSFGTDDDLIKSPGPKQSTPLWEGNNQNGHKNFRPNALKLHSPDNKKQVFSDSKEARMNISIHTHSAEISPVDPINDQIFPIENETEENCNATAKSNRDSLESGKNFVSKTKSNISKRSPEISPTSLKMNQTFDKKQQPDKNQESHKLNQTAQRKSPSPKVSRKESHSPVRQTDAMGHSKLNATFSKNSASKPKNLNSTFTKKRELEENEKVNQTFNISPPHEASQLNQTYDKEIARNQLNETFDKDRDSFLSKTQIVDGTADSPAFNQTFTRDSVLESICQGMETQELNLTIDKNKIPEELEVDDNNGSTEGSRTFRKPISLQPVSMECETLSVSDDLHRNSFSENSNKASEELTRCESFKSANSSNSDVSTVLLNEKELSENQSIDDLSEKLGKIDLNAISEVDGVTEFDGQDAVFPECISEDLQNMQTEEKLLNSLKDEKLRCDPDLVQFIQEQFSPNDIEKICNVVQEMTPQKLSSDILRASETFDKSFHGNLSSVDFKPAETVLKTDNDVNPLSPHSLDFLNSIGGKPTGRDLSRESLYVKFDPLVQPSANSLIDFTKEGEALPAITASPPSPHSTSICEQLLAISPEKKPDDIVPPLTPLSHKAKTDLNEEKLEKLKELQNEIYFLKNLYTERERTNKVKLEDYESQIAKLTGESCFLADKLKESNEREKSLVKKLKEQTQSITQLKIVIEEYVKVISKLAGELETLKKESTKQVETLTQEKDSYITHLHNTEAAFTDVHTKYEKSKKTIVSLKSNESMYRNTIANQTKKLDDFKEKAKEAQEKALVEFQKIQEELNEAKTGHAQEIARLRAQLRKTELKVEALQESLDQKVKENQQLTAICDELIEGKK